MLRITWRLGVAACVVFAAACAGSEDGGTCCGESSAVSAEAPARPGDVDRGPASTAAAAERSSPGPAPTSPPPTAPAAPFRLYLMRHAEAFKNLPHDPATDPAKLEDLTEKGRKQAVDAAPKLKDVSAPFYCSPAGRARATAALVAETRGAAPPVSDPGFGPLVDGKDVDGKPFPIAKRMSAWKRGEDPKPADGESLADVKARAAAAANALAKAHPGGAAVV
ncbi:MAG TPA: phosphoglycerate mutase family protein, partial [Planctomycetota bacterium]|nr:phosphoglycerate mutase family protein [Planctomycetota bacterium]